MGYDEETANLNESLAGTMQQRSDQYDKNCSDYNIGSHTVLVNDSNSANGVGSGDSLIDSYKQMIKEKGLPPRSSGISGNNGLGVILEDGNLISPAKVEVIETKQNVDPYQKKQHDDDGFYMESSSRGSSLVNSYKDFVTERAASVSGISSLGGSMNSRNIEYQNNQRHRRNSNNSSNASDSNSRNRSFGKSSDLSVMSSNITEPEYWEEEAGYHDPDISKPTKRSGSPDIRLRKTTVCIMASLIFMLMALCAFFFSVWYNTYGVENGGLPSLVNLDRGADTNTTILLQDKCPGEEDLKSIQEENEQLGAQIIELDKQVERLLTENSALNTTMDDLQSQNEALRQGNSLQKELNEQLNSSMDDSNAHNAFLSNEISACTGNNNDMKARIELLEANAAQALKQREEMEQQNSNLLGNVDSIQGENIILQNLKDNLDISIDSLEEQINSLSEQNNELNTTVKVLENHIGDLEKNNDQYQKLNNQLNQSISKLSDENARLENQVSEYANLNEDLNATAYELGKEVQKLQGEIGELEQLNDRLDESVTNLAEETKNLQESNKDFKNNIEELSSQIEQLSGENDELQASNNKLETIVGYLNETSQNLDETFEDLMSLLAEQISAYRVLVLEGIQNTYHQSVASWDCNFVDRFSLEDFSTNWNKMILPPKSDEVMEYVDDRVLSNLCLSPTDFDHYVKDRYPDSISTGITTNQLRTAVERYTMAAFNYYFPDYDDVNSGLTDEDWAQAGYDCDQLPERKKFIQFPLM